MLKNLWRGRIESQLDHVHINASAMGRGSNRGGSEGNLSAETFFPEREAAACAVMARSIGVLIL